MITCPPIHREHFEQWLHQQPDERTWDFWCNACVWGSFMTEFHKVSYISVGVLKFSLEEKSTSLPFDLPDWFKVFSLKMEEMGSSEYPLITMSMLRKAFNLPKESPAVSPEPVHTH